MVENGYVLMDMFFEKKIINIRLKFLIVLFDWKSVVKCKELFCCC